MTDNWVEEFGPGGIVVTPPGHNAWIIGDESAIAIDFTDMVEYAKESQK